MEDSSLHCWRATDYSSGLPRRERDQPENVCSGEGRSGDWEPRNACPARLPLQDIPALAVPSLLGRLEWVGCASLPTTTREWDLSLIGLPVYLRDSKCNHACERLVACCARRAQENGVVSDRRRSGELEYQPFGAGLLQVQTLRSG